jgi:hypothetical protein
VLGTTRYETAGSLTRTEPARTGACSVIAPDNNAPAIQVTVGPGSISRAGASAVATVEGTKVTGALSHLVRACDVVGVRRLRPRPGRDAVHDAVSLATAVAEELGLPVH